MTRLDTISVELTAEIDQFRRSMQQAGQIVERQRTGIVSNLAKASQGFFFVTQAAGTLVNAGRQVAEFGQAVFDLGADAGETASKFQMTLGPATQQAQEFLERFANTAGLTVTEGRELISVTSGIAMGFGMTQTEAAGFAEEILSLAGDMTSYTNVPMQETSRAIQSALTGERESLKRLGVVIRETDVQQKALTQTGKESASALTDQEKATATLALIQERASFMIGNLADTQDSAANRARALGARLREMQELLARAFLPALEEVLGTLGDISGSEGMAGFVESIVAARDQIAAWAVVGVEVTQAVAIALVNVVQILVDMAQRLYAVGEGLYNLAQADFRGAVRSFRGVVDETESIMGNLGDILDGFDGLGGAIDAAMKTGKADVASFVAGLDESEQRVIDNTAAVIEQGEAFADVGDDIAAMFDEYTDAQRGIERRPLNIVFGDMSPAEIGDGFREDVGRTYEIMSEEVARNKDIRDAMAANQTATILLREEMQDLATVGYDAAMRIAKAMESISPRLAPVADGFRSFVDDLRQGTNFADTIANAIGAIKTGGLSLLIDTAIGVLGDIFSRDSRAEQQAKRIREALQSNEQALRENTDAQIRVITGGMGGGTISDILDALAVAFGGAEFDVFDPRFEGIAGQFFETPMQMFQAILANMGLDYEQVADLAEQLGISLDGGTESFEQLMQKLQDLIGGQLSDFMRAFDNILDMFDLRGVSPGQQVADLISFLSDQVGPDLANMLQALLSASPDEAGNIIADIIENLREGGDLFGQLGGIASEEFISVLENLFGIIQQAATGIESGAGDDASPYVPEGEPPFDLRQALRDMMDIFELRGTSAAEQFSDILGLLTANVGGPLADLLQGLIGATEDEAGNLIADILQNLRSGGDLLGALGDIELADFERALFALFDLFDEMETERRFQDDPLNATMSTYQQATNDQIESNDRLFELHTVSYDAMLKRLETLETNVTTLITTNRTGFDDVAAAARS